LFKQKLAGFRRIRGFFLTPETRPFRLVNGEEASSLIHARQRPVEVAQLFADFAPFVAMGE
jgi:hypothetical protein